MKYLKYNTRSFGTGTNLKKIFLFVSISSDTTHINGGGILRIATWLLLAGKTIYVFPSYPILYIITNKRGVTSQRASEFLVAHVM
jgi:hypothetical protein